MPVNKKRKNSHAGTKTYDALENRCVLSGVTIVTHGWQLIGGPGSDAPGWAIELGTSVLDRAGSNGSIFLHDTRPQESTFGEWVPLDDFSGTGQTWQNSNDPTEEIVLVYNWVWDSNDGEAGWLEAAADNLFASLVQVQEDVSRFGELSGNSFADLALDGGVYDFHFIGHSRGAVLNSLAVNRFGHYFPDLQIDQVTTLDPHPIASGFVGNLFYESSDPNVYTYNNVVFADNYYRSDGLYQDADFDGLPVNGAWNIELNENILGVVETSPGVFAENGYVTEHSDVHLWYRATIDTDRNLWDTAGTLPVIITPFMNDNWWSNAAYNGADEPNNGRENVGYGRSRIGGLDRSNFEVVSGNGIFTPDSVFNGNFQNGDRLFDEIPGWERHGGGGNGNLAPFTFAANGYLELSSSNQTLIHNNLYIPPSSQSISLDLQRTKRSDDDYLEIILDEITVGTFLLNDTDPSFLEGGLFVLPLDSSLAGAVGKLSIGIVSPIQGVESRIRIDNIAFSDSAPIPLADPGGPYSVDEGAVIALDGSGSTSAHPLNGDVEYFWDLDENGVFGEIFGARGNERGVRPTFDSSSTDGPEVVEIGLRLVASGVDATPQYTNVTIQNVAPSAVIDGPAFVSANQEVSYTVIVTDPSPSDHANLDSSDYSWTATVDGIEYTDTGTTFTFVPTSNEQFDVSVEVMDDDGGRRTATKVVNLVVDEEATLNQRIDQGLNQIGDSDVYFLQGQAGRELSVTAFWGDEREGGHIRQFGQFRLIGPDGSVLAAPGQVETSEWFRSSTLHNFVLPQDGTYFVEVSSTTQNTTNGTGAYWLGISNPLEDFTELSLTEPSTIVFGVQGDWQEFTFDATAGQAVGWTYHGVRQLENWSIFDPNGQLVIGDQNITNRETFAFTPTITGEHRLVFEDTKFTNITSAGHVGAFTYTITPAITAPLNERIDGNIPAVRDTFLYAVSGQAGRELSVTAFWGDEREGGHIRQFGQFRLIGPDGSVLAAPGQVETSEWFRSSTLHNFVLPQDGTYFVEVSSTTQNTTNGTGAYWLGISNPLEESLRSFRLFDPGSTGRPISQFPNLSATEITAAAFGVQGDWQEYSFMADAGQSLGWTYQGARPLENWSIYGPDGQFITGGINAPSNENFIFTATKSGEHQLIFEDTKFTNISSAGHVGPFNYTLTPLTLQTGANQSATIVNGDLIAGGSKNLQLSDDSYLSLFSAPPTKQSLSPLSVEFAGQVQNLAPEFLAFQIEAAANTVNLSQVVDVFNFNAGNYEQASVSPAELTDTTFVIEFTGDLSRFINTNGEVRARTSYFQDGPIFFSPWSVRFDQVSWIVDTNRPSPIVLVDDPGRDTTHRTKENRFEEVGIRDIDRTVQSSLTNAKRLDQNEAAMDRVFEYAIETDESSKMLFEDLLGIGDILIEMDV